jgi:hypothetical protein
MNAYTIFSVIALVGGVIGAFLNAYPREKNNPLFSNMLYFIGDLSALLYFYLMKDYVPMSQNILFLIIVFIGIYQNRPININTPKKLVKALDKQLEKFLKAQEQISILQDLQLQMIISHKFSEKEISVFFQSVKEETPPEPIKDKQETVNS